MKTKFFFLIPLLCVSCQSKDTSKTLFASFAPIKEFVSYIVGDKYKVESIVPPGTEPHDFELSSSKLAELINSKGLFINGFKFERWSDSLPNEVKNKTCDLSNGVTPIYINNQIDPHIWLSPINAIKEMENIYNRMIYIDEDNKGYYLNNFNEYKNKFTALDEELMEISSSLTQKNIVVSHAAYGYMCNRYGLNQIYINGIEADEEPNTKTLAEIIDKVEELGITTIFTEELISSQIAKKIADETGVKIEMLNTLESIDEGEDYFSLMKDNFTKIKEASK